MRDLLPTIAWRLGVIAVPVIALGLAGWAAYKATATLVGRGLRWWYERDGGAR